MLGQIRRRYWKTREALSVALRRLKRDPPIRRLKRYIQTHCRLTIELDDILIRLSPDMGTAPVKHILAGRYESPERRILESCLEKGDRVLELGTGIGYLSALCARRIGSDRVFTFEANPQLRSRITETYALNKVAPHAEFCMLGEQSGYTSFYVSNEFWSSSTLTQHRDAHQITIPVKAFNDVLAKYKPNLLIIDIEGGEADLIRFMRLDGITKICIELHPDEIGKDAEQRVREFFVQQGFREDATVSDEEHVLYRRKQEGKEGKH